ncbi:MAG: tRNA(Ile)-lysidine synthase [Kiritimatiellia bacterium]
MTHPGRLRDRVASTVVERGLWQHGDRVAVAVSGGLDSVCLLDMLVRTQGLHGAVLSVASVDHGTREGSADDLMFVQQLAVERGLLVHRAAFELGVNASEQACRQARYEFFDALDVDRVALAHHMDDQAETLLLQLLRGAGARGLSGMAPRRGRYVRPLLDVRRHQLESWAAHRGLIWRDDPSNLDPRYLRNRVRAELLPLMDSLRPGAAVALSRAASRSAEDDSLLDALSRDEAGASPGPNGWASTWVRDAPQALVRRALLRGLPGAGAAHIDAILRAVKRGAGVVHLPGGTAVHISARWVGHSCGP